ncbi:hypothetical protein MMC29_005039, partial [Sticta canariensis]|nr:hypothetical protein [Sticta canariensis]
STPRIAMAITTQTAVSSTQSPRPINIVDSTSSIPRGPVTANLSFFSPPTEDSVAYQYVEPQPAGHPQRNFSDAHHDVQISDIRGSESNFSLDINAFKAVSSVPSSSDIDFDSDDSVKQKYYPEVESLLLKNLPGASRVHIFDYTIRRSSPSAPRAPVNRVHIDQTPASALARVPLHLPAAEASELLKSRVRIVNVWRPLNGAVESFPLAFADSTSVPAEALVGMELRYPNRTGETAGVKKTDGQRWYYWSGIDGDERLLLQCFDSEKGARVPHTAFVDPRTKEGAKGRESIEVRALVFG